MSEQSAEESGNGAGIRYEEPGEGVARIVLARPEARNAQDKPMLYALNAAFDRAAQDDAVRCIILAADGPHFSSGHDLRDGSAITDFDLVGTWGGPRFRARKGTWRSSTKSTWGSAGAGAIFPSPPSPRCRERPLPVA